MFEAVELWVPASPLVPREIAVHVEHVAVETPPPEAVPDHQSPLTTPALLSVWSRADPCKLDQLVAIGMPEGPVTAMELENPYKAGKLMGAYVELKAR